MDKNNPQFTTPVKKIKTESQPIPQQQHTASLLSISSPFLRTFSSECPLCKENRDATLEEKNEVIEVIKCIVNNPISKHITIETLKSFYKFGGKNVYHIVFENINSFKDELVYALLHFPEIERQKNKFSTNYVKPFYSCCINNIPSLTKLIIEHGFNDKEHLMWNGVNFLAHGGYTEQLEVLIDKKFELNEVKNGWTPLLFACKKGNIRMVRLLIENGAHVNLCGTKGWSPLMFSCIVPKIEIVELLLKNGAHIDYLTETGNSCLGYAVEVRNFDAIMLFLEHAPDFYLKTHLGNDIINNVRTNITKCIKFSTGKVNDQFQQLSDIFAPHNLEWYCRRNRAALLKAIDDEQKVFHSLFYSKFRFKGEQMFAPLPREFIDDVLKTLHLSRRG